MECLTGSSIEGSLITIAYRLSSCSPTRTSSNQAGRQGLTNGECEIAEGWNRSFRYSMLVRGDGYAKGCYLS